MRQVVLDTETTGLEVELQHRIIEVGCVELNNRRLTGRVFHRYLDPERDIDAGAQEVHGITRERLRAEPKFAEIAAELIEFLSGAELIIHNAPFDVAFLNAEFKRCTAACSNLGELCRIVDSLALARQMHPGQRNNLDALCKRYSVDNTHREYHGALLDARILAEVYLAMTGGQAALSLGAQSDSASRTAREDGSIGTRTGERRRIPVIAATETELAAHAYVLGLVDKASGGHTVWRSVPSVS
jgi:DNA polymerase-3 subunit epsilon